MSRKPLRFGTEAPDRPGPRQSGDYEELLVIATSDPASRGRLHEIDESLVFTRLLQGRIAERLHAGLEKTCPRAYAARRSLVPGRTPFERARQVEAFTAGKPWEGPQGSPEAAPSTCSP